MTYYSQKQKEYSMKYAKKNLKRIPLDVQLSEYDLIKVAADTTGTTVNGFIKECIREKIESLQNAGIIPVDSNNDSSDSNK